MTEPAKPLPCPASFPLFKHMSDTYGLTMLESEMDEIAHKVYECRYTDPRLAELRAIAEELAKPSRWGHYKRHEQALAAFDQWKERNPV